MKQRGSQKNKEYEVADSGAVHGEPLGPEQSLSLGPGASCYWTEISNRSFWQREGLSGLRQVAGGRLAGRALVVLGINDQPALWSFALAFGVEIGFVT